MTPHLDMSRHAATGDDIAPDLLFTLTIPDVAQRYLDAGYPKNPRTIQRYAAAGKIRAQKQMTATGELYLINPESVDLHITELSQMDAQARLVAAGRGMSRQAATPFSSSQGEQMQHRQSTTLSRPAATIPDMSSPVAVDFEPLSATTSNDIQRQEDNASDQTRTDMARHGATSRDTSRQKRDEKSSDAATGHDSTRPVATSQPPADDRYVKLLERENEFLRDQVNKKDSQIESLSRLAESTNTNVSQQNTLLQGFQRMLGLGHKSEGRGDHEV